MAKVNGYLIIIRSASKDNRSSQPRINKLYANGRRTRWCLFIATSGDNANDTDNCINNKMPGKNVAPTGLIFELHNVVYSLKIGEQFPIV